jgi:uncharacterized protein (TIGR02271 family)
MQHTLIAVFDNRSSAQSAMTELLGSGFDRASVRLNEENSPVNTTSMTPGQGAADEGLGASIKHFFSDLFTDDDTSHAQKYSTAIDRGHTALTVTAFDDAEIERAADIIERFNPIDIDEKTAEWGGASTQGQATAVAPNVASLSGNTPTNVPATTQQRDISGGTAIPIVQEQLKVGKREVQRGGVRVYSRIVETPVQENVSLREEHVHVERRPVDQLLSADNTVAFKEQTIELRESGEEVVVQKTARVVEEVVVSKGVTERQQSVNDTVRHTEVEVEQLGANDGDTDSVQRAHFASNYGTAGKSYEDYSPAYSYGTEMANQYRGRQWNDVEGDLRTNWESRNAGSASTWEEFKGAVRHGWDSITK